MIGACSNGWVHFAGFRSGLRAQFGMLALLICYAYPADAQKTTPITGLVKLPVIDKQDIRFAPLSVGGEKLKRWVHGIAQDAQGFIWFATDDGLYKYDGYTLSPYLHDPGIANSISSGNLYTVYKDRDGILWIGNVGEGADRLDPARGAITHYRHQPGIESSLGDNSVRCIYQDRSGRFGLGQPTGWIASIHRREHSFTIGTHHVIRQV